MYQVAYDPLASGGVGYWRLEVSGSAYREPAQLREEIRFARDEKVGVIDQVESADGVMRNLAAQAAEVLRNLPI